MYRITSPDTVVRGIESDRHYKPSRDFIVSRIDNQLQKRHGFEDEFKEGEPIFYPPDIMHQHFSPDHPVWSRLCEVRSVVAEILANRGSAIYQAKQFDWYENTTALNEYNPQYRSLESNGRLYRYRTPDNRAKYGAVYPGFPKINQDHPYLVPEELHQLQDKVYVNFVPYRSNPVVLGDCAGRLSQMELIKVILDAMLACAAIHRNGDAHADVKPDNIFVRRDHRGLVGNLFDHEFRRPIENVKNMPLAGSPYYMPQFWDGDRTAVDYRHNDVFAFGMSLFEALGFSLQFNCYAHEYSDRTREFSHLLLMKKRYLSRSLIDVVLDMLLCHKRKKALPLERYITTLAQEFGLVLTERMGSMYVEFPETYVPSYYVQDRFGVAGKREESHLASDMPVVKMA